MNVNVPAYLGLQVFNTSYAFTPAQPADVHSFSYFPMAHFNTSPSPCQCVFLMGKVLDGLGMFVMFLKLL